MIRLGEQERAREEDPYTGYMIAGLPISKVIVAVSRFQLDINRIREKAIHRQPEDAWGLQVWKHPMPEALEKKLLQDYDTFYQAMDMLIEAAIATHGHFIILDVHSYNHRRDDPFVMADAAGAPEINLGTWYNKPRWHSLCDRYEDFLGQQDIMGHKVDVRQNIIFKGGGFAQQVLQRYGEHGCVLSIEFKKTFMDEWTGIAHIPHILELRNLLKDTLHFLENELKQLRTV